MRKLMKKKNEAEKILKLLQDLEKETEGQIQAKVALIRYKYENLLKS